MSSLVILKQGLENFDSEFNKNRMDSKENADTIYLRRRNCYDLILSSKKRGTLQ